MQTVIGIDVGGLRKGFHAVALRGREFEAHHFKSAAEAAEWSKALNPAAIAIDSPCCWSAGSRSRACERELHIDGQRISCFSTPSKVRAQGRSFYDWVRNGLRLYRAIASSHPLYQGDEATLPLSCETFPQAVACMLAGRKVPARHKSKHRRQILRDEGYPVDGLNSIDEVDAALCAITAEALIRGSHQAFGDPSDGLIVTPRARFSNRCVKSTPCAKDFDALRVGNVLSNHPSDPGAGLSSGGSSRPLPLGSADQGSGMLEHDGGRVRKGLHPQRQ